MPRPAQAVLAPPGTPAKPPHYTSKTVPPRVRRVLELMVFHGYTRKDAAEAVGLKDNTIYQHLRNPNCLREYHYLLGTLRESERARNIHTALAVRDDKQEHGKTKLLACRYLDGETATPNTVINFGVNVTVKPGYIVDVSAHAERATQLLQVSGGGPAAVTYQGDSNSRADAEPSEQAYTQPDDASEDE